MADNSIKAGDVQYGIFSTGHIGGDASIKVNTNTDSEKEGNQELKEMLAQLKEAIEDDSDLPQEKKEEALEQVVYLGEVEQVPENKEKKRGVSGAIAILKGIMDKLPNATKFVTACRNLLPSITSLFGL